MQSKSQPLNDQFQDRNLDSPHLLPSHAYLFYIHVRFESCESVGAVGETVASV